MVEFRLQQFSGPLDLLLGLLDEKKLSISGLALSEVTEQYLAYIDGLEETDPDELADFLLVATRLLLLKARSLLPQFMPEEDEGPDLAEQLRLYKAFVQASRRLNKAWLSLEFSAFRVEPPRKVQGFILPLNVNLDALRVSMVQLVSRLQPPKPLPETKIDATLSMKEKISQIRDLLRSRARANFHDFLKNRNNKTELIVSFLALLELVKQRTVSLDQKGQFGDIVVLRA